MACRSNELGAAHQPFINPSIRIYTVVPKISHGGSQLFRDMQSSSTSSVCHISQKKNVKTKRFVPVEGHIRIPYFNFSHGDWQLEGNVLCPYATYLEKKTVV